MDFDRIEKEYEVLLKAFAEIQAIWYPDVHKGIETAFLPVSFKKHGFHQVISEYMKQPDKNQAQLNSVAERMAANPLTDTIISLGHSIFQLKGDLDEAQKKYLSIDTNEN